MLFTRLQGAAQDRPFQLERGSLKDLHVYVIDNKLQITESLTGKDLKHFNLVYFELWAKATQQALAAAIYCNRHSIAFFSSETLHTTVTSKVGELVKMAENGIPLPATVLTSNRELKILFKTNPPINFPLVIKASSGYGGKDNYLVADLESLNTVLENNSKLEFIVQEFIPNDCDYRCIVVGNEIRLVLKRSRPNSSLSHLNNTSQGGIGELVALDSISKAGQQAVLKAARVLGRQEFAGVDLLFHAKTNQPYILEVNQAPQIEIGAAVDAKMATLLDYISARIDSGGAL